MSTEITSKFEQIRQKKRLINEQIGSLRAALNEALVEARQNVLHMSVSELASNLGVTTSYISMLESDRQMVSDKIFRRLDDLVKRKLANTTSS